MQYMGIFCTLVSVFMNNFVRILLFFVDGELCGVELLKIVHLELENLLHPSKD